MEAIEIRCSGKVQGVFFRVSTKSKAEEIGITGWVKNEFDGSVLIYAEGSKESLQELLEWCKKGPLLAEVSNVEVKEVVPEGFKSFEIKHS